MIPVQVGGCWESPEIVCTLF